MERPRARLLTPTPNVGGFPPSLKGKWSSADVRCPQACSDLESVAWLCPRGASSSAARRTSLARASRRFTTLTQGQRLLQMAARYSDPSDRLREREISKMATPRPQVDGERLPCAERVYVYRVCLRLCSDADQAEGLTQDTLLRACAALRGFEARSTIQTWLYRIAVRAWAQSRLGSTRADLWPCDRTQESDSPDPSEEVIAAVGLQRAIGALTPALRQIALLCITGGSTAREAAETLRICASGAIPG